MLISLQTLSLHEQMSVYENFTFYGYLFGMETDAIRSRSEDLLKFLELPSGHRLVRELR